MPLQKNTSLFFSKIVILSLLFIINIQGQNLSLYNQFNGRFDFTFVGNTMNPNENSFQTVPSIFTSSSATLTLNPNDVVEKAFIYWAGCGTGDFNIKLNNIDVTSERNFSNVLNTQFNFFSAFADVTSIIQNQGNGTYTVSDLDVSSFIELHHLNRTNFAGWAIVVVYKNDTLPLNQLNIYDGLQVVSSTQNLLTINLNSINVFDNDDAKLGFVAWEGDVNIANNESLTFNGNVLSNPPLNPENNAFNSTNSITGSTTLYNMDLDIYNIENNIQIGDTSALIELTSFQDYVMINTVVTKLNSQLPDATITIDAVNQECDSNAILVDYTVSNNNATKELPANTPIAIYANDVLIDFTETLVTIPINESWSSQIILSIPSTVPNNFELKLAVDDLGTSIGIVNEIVETNNTALLNVSQFFKPKFYEPQDLTTCNIGFGKGIFDFSLYEEEVKMEQNDSVSFYENNENAEMHFNPILNPFNYETTQATQTIFVRIENENCFAITSFNLSVINCPPEVYNFVSSNNDGLNDDFFIENLRDIFLNFELFVYNRWGKLVWQGNNNLPNWDGTIKEGFINTNAPNGTYFYVLKLNDDGYPDDLTGYLYLTR